MWYITSKNKATNRLVTDGNGTRRSTGLNWWNSPQYAAQAQDGSTVYPTWIMDAANQRYAKSSSPTGSVSQAAFSGLLENFTRSSTAMYFDASGTLQTAAINQPRFTYDPVTLQPLGLLVEEQRANNFTYSNALTNAPWQKWNGTISNALSGVVGPDGGSIGGITADGTGSTRVSRLHTFETSSDVIVSGFGKPLDDANTIFGIQLNNSTAFPTQNGTTQFNTADMSITFASGVTVGGFVKLANGFYFFWIRATSSENTANTDVRFYASLAGTPAAGKRFALGFFQQENGSLPTSYIPTAGSTVTRAQDEAYTTDMSWFNSLEGTFIVKSFTGAGTPLGFGNSVGNNRGQILDSVSESGFFGTDNVGNTRTVRITTGQIFGQQKTTGASYSNNYLAAFANGVKLAMDTNGWAQWLPNRLSIGRRYSNTPVYGNQPVAYALYYPKRLTDAEIQRLTTL